MNNQFVSNVIRLMKREGPLRTLVSRVQYRTLLFSNFSLFSHNLCDKDKGVEQKIILGCQQIEEELNKLDEVSADRQLEDNERVLRK